MNYSGCREGRWSQKRKEGAVGGPSKGEAGGEQTCAAQRATY
jgi:hypothetical protein